MEVGGRNAGTTSAVEESELSGREPEWRCKGWVTSQPIIHRKYGTGRIMNVSPNDFLSLI